MVYANTSVLASRYIYDANSSQVMNLMMSVNQRSAWTTLHRLELLNAFALAVFRGLITTQQSFAAWKQLAVDLRAGRYLRTLPPWHQMLREASKLAARHSATLGTRSLDILHVAAAKELGVTTFLTFDKRQRSLALTVGLQVLP